MQLNSSYSLTHSHAMHAYSSHAIIVLPRFLYVNCFFLTIFVFDNHSCWCLSNGIIFLVLLGWPFRSAITRFHVDLLLNDYDNMKYELQSSKIVWACYFVWFIIVKWLTYSASPAVFVMLLLVVVFCICNNLRVLGMTYNRIHTEWNYIE